MLIFVSLQAFYLLVMPMHLLVERKFLMKFTTRKYAKTHHVYGFCGGKRTDVSVRIPTQIPRSKNSYFSKISTLHLRLMERKTVHKQQNEVGLALRDVRADELDSTKGFLTVLKSAVVSQPMKLVFQRVKLRFFFMKISSIPSTSQVLKQQNHMMLCSTVTLINIYFEKDPYSTLISPVSRYQVFLTRTTYTSEQKKTPMLSRKVLFKGGSMSTNGFVSQIPIL